MCCKNYKVLILSASAKELRMVAAFFFLMGGFSGFFLHFLLKG